VTDEPSQADGGRPSFSQARAGLSRLWRDRTIDSTAIALDLARPLMPEDEWARIDRYVLEDVGHGTDVFGTTPEGLGPAYAMAWWLHENYFRVVSAGHENIPDTGAAVLAGNHSGVLPFDATMVTADVFRHKDPPRLVRYMVDFFVYRVPFLGTVFRSLGQIPGTRRNYEGLIEEGHLVGVFPEGAEALGKPMHQRYQLRDFSHGHVELAARHGVPVVPFGLVGAEEQQTMISDLKPLARALNLPFVPVTTTFPWFGPLGILPRPSRYFIHYGEPIDIDPIVLERIEARNDAVQRVQDAVKELLAVGQDVRRRYREGAS